MELRADEHERCTAIDAHRLMARLWQGSFPWSGEMLRSLGFDVLVLCADELQTPSDFRRHARQMGMVGAPDFAAVGVFKCPLDDQVLSASETRRATDAARWLVKAYRGGSRILITCAQGRNRSGLVSALTLRLLTGCSGGAAAQHIQAIRPRALMNQTFVAYLETLPDRSGRVRDRAASSA